MKRLLLWIRFAVGVCVIGGSPVHAYVHALPSTLALEVLSESVPTALAPGDFEAADFALEWLGPALPGVELRLGRKSLEWVRVADFLVLPRARLLLTAKEVEGGLVSHHGFSQGFSLREGLATAEVPIALISGEQNQIKVTILKNGSSLEGTVIVRYRPREASSGPRIYTDPSCSPYKVRAGAQNLKSDSWMIIGCRLVYAEGAEQRTSSLETFVYWDNVGQRIQVGGVDVDATSTSVWPLRLRSFPGEIKLQTGEQRVNLTYFAAEKLRLGSLSLGIGPYTYVVDAFDASVNAVVPLLTVYGSFFITENLRIVAFDATAFHKQYYTDFGIYINSEYLKVLDRRIILNIMLGAHVIGFPAEGKAHWNIGAPQGMELIFRDAFKKGYNFSAGAFIYPPIQRKLYYNAWLRWGSGPIFAEFNYIAWQEVLDRDRAYSRSVGLTFGFPLFRFY